MQNLASWLRFPVFSGSLLLIASLLGPPLTIFAQARQQALRPHSRCNLFSGSTENAFNMFSLVVTAEKLKVEELGEKFKAFHEKFGSSVQQCPSSEWPYPVSIYIVLISKVVSANRQIKYSNFPFDDFRYFLGQELEYLFGRKDINKVVH